MARTAHRIEDCTFEELKLSVVPFGQTIPALQDVLRMVAGGFRLLSNSR